MKSKTHSWMRAVTLLFVATGLLTLPAQAQTNLLKNPNFSEKYENNPAGWGFSTWNLDANPQWKAHIEWGTKQVDDANCLFIKAKDPLKAHVWWQQSLQVSGAGVYHLSVSAKVDSKSTTERAFLSVGIHFLDATGQWLGYQSIAPKTPPTGDWEEVSGTIEVPENAEKIGVRLGTNFDGTVEVYFKDPVLTVD